MTDHLKRYHKAEFETSQNVAEDKTSQPSVSSYFGGKIVQKWKKLKGWSFYIRPRQCIG